MDAKIVSKEGVAPKCDENERPSVIYGTAVGREIPKSPTKLSSSQPHQGVPSRPSSVSTWIHHELKSPNTSSSLPRQHHYDYCYYGEQKMPMHVWCSQDNKTIASPNYYSSAFRRDDMLINGYCIDVKDKINHNEFFPQATDRGNLSSQDTQAGEWRQEEKNQITDQSVENGGMPSLSSKFPNQISLGSHLLSWNESTVNWEQKASVNWDHSNFRFVPTDFHKHSTTSYAKPEGFAQCHDNVTHAAYKFSNWQEMAKNVLKRSGAECLDPNNQASCGIIPSSAIDKQFLNDVTYQSLNHLLVPTPSNHGPIKRNLASTASAGNNLRLYSMPKQYPFQIKLDHDSEDVITMRNDSNTCKICNKVFKRSHYLKSHMLIHSGSKPYKCSYCIKRFSQVGNRNAHERLHTGLLPHVCEICDKRFNFISALETHMKIHFKNS